jgi:hypothetical protein
MHRSAFAVIILVLISLTLGACATRPTYNIGTQTPTRSPVSNTTIAIVDKRPADDRESSMGSLLISSSSYGIYILGDERFVPAPLAALSQRLQRATATWPSHPQVITLTVNRLNIQINIQAAARHSTATDSGLTELGIELGELIMGKMREENIDLRKPFVLCVIEANADILWGNGRREPRKISVIKAQNYDEMTPQDQVGKIVTATVSSSLDAATAALAK